MAYYQTKIIFTFVIFAVFAFVAPSVTNASTLPALPTVRQNLNESVNRFIQARDGDSTNMSSEQNNLTHRKKIISDVLALSLQEITSVREKLNATHIDKESQLWTIREIILRWLNAEEKYFREIKDRVDNDLNLGEVKALAREIQNHRNENYNANLINALDFILILRTLRLTDVAENRWNRINTDLQKIEGAGLIRVSSFAPQMSEAKERIDSARSLAEKSLVLIKNIYLPIPEESPAPFIAEISDNNESIKTEQKPPSIRELCETAMNNLKLGYNEFVQISIAVRKLLRLP